MARIKRSCSVFPKLNLDVIQARATCPLYIHFLHVMQTLRDITQVSWRACDISKDLRWNWKPKLCAYTRTKDHKLVAK